MPKRKRKSVDTMFAKWGSDDNFFTLKGRAARVADAILGVFGAQRKGQQVTHDISAFVGRGVDRRVPSLGDPPKDRSRSATVNISGAGHQDASVPDIGGDGKLSEKVPDIGGQRNKSRGGRVPAIGGRREPGPVPDLSGKYGAADSSVPNISGGPGGRGFESISNAMPAVGRSVLALFGMHELSPSEERNLRDFVTRARNVGLPISVGAQAEIRYRWMRDRMSKDAIWKTWVGEEIKDRERQKRARDKKERESGKRKSMRDRVKGKFDQISARAVPMEKPISREEFFSEP